MSNHFCTFSFSFLQFGSDESDSESSGSESDQEGMGDLDEEELAALEKMKIED